MLFQLFHSGEWTDGWVGAVGSSDEKNLFSVEANWAIEAYKVKK